MKCYNHKDKVTKKTCVGCGRPFCDECLLNVNDKKYCEECAAEEIKKRVNSKNDQQTNVVQRTNIQQSDDIKPKGSYLVLILWIIFLWPVAIFYYLIRRWD